MSRFSTSIARHPNAFAWENLGGYDSADGHELYSQSLYLRPAGVADIQKQFRENGQATLPDWYDPFTEEPALFRIFASLNGTPEAIRDFANKYGDIATLEVLSEGEGGMSLAEWQSEIKGMCDFLDEADWLVAQRVPKRNLAEHTDDVADLIDRTLNGVPVYLSTVVKNGVVALRTNTYNLLDAMKLQLVEAIVEKKSYRTCEHCGKPFEVSPQINRSDRVYCSDNCRVKAYQRRRKQAIAMRGKGETLREIAKKLGSDMPTVKKWVGEARKEE